MRVLHIIADGADGDSAATNSVLALAGAGVELAVVLRSDDPLRLEQLRDNRVKVATANFDRSWPFPTYVAISAMVRNFHPDVAKFWMGRAVEFAPQTLAPRAIGWHADYSSRAINCEWHVGASEDLLRHIRAQGVAEDRSALISPDAFVPDSLTFYDRVATTASRRG